MSQQSDRDERSSTTPLGPAVQAGLVGGTAGFITGGTVAIFKSKGPLWLWTSYTALHWGSIGFTYWGIRDFVLDSVPAFKQSSSKLEVSALSAGLSFAFMNAILRGRRTIISGAMIGSVLGLTGQGVYNILDRRHTKTLMQSEPSRTIWERLLASEWSPINKMSDEDYIKMLSEKRLRLDAEVAILDDEISELEKQQELQAQISNLRNDKK